MGRLWAVRVKVWFSLGSPCQRTGASCTARRLEPHPVVPELMSSIADQWGPFWEGLVMAKLVLIDGEGVADLSDGTHWCIAYDQLP